jgi:TonB-linked SusC/RagA family outer membrane protein
MKRKNLLFSMLFVLLQVAVFAQGKVIKGTITDSKTKETLPGVTVLVEGTTMATSTNMNGEFTINVEGEGKKLVISSIGYVTKTVAADQDVINITLDSDAKLLTETVVTALGVSREKKSLGYATQEISGADLTQVKSGNFVNQISGKVAGVQIKNSGNMGGSTNILIRGTTSIFGNNQALFVIDGVPMNNSVTNGDITGGNRITGGGQSSGQSGYDYGSPISDINPEDIETMNVLKGAAATALYGARAANGVIIITTKKGRTAGVGRQRFGVTFSSNVTMGVIDKSTFPTYQKKYGGGYGPDYDGGPGNFFWLRDVNGVKNETVVPLTEDASWGAAFDPSYMVYQWDAFVPGMPNYGKKTPWVNHVDDGPITFFKKSYSFTNSVNVDGGTDKSSFRVSYSNNNQTGILPNSSLKKNTIGFNGSTQLNDKFSVSVSGNYVKNEAVGRNSTGYNNNELTSFRQWWQTNTSLVDQKKIYDQTKANYSWNPGDINTPLEPIYWDNFYFSRNESYSSDQRDRFYGNTALTYKINDIINVVGRMSIDQYATLQEERLAIGNTAKSFGTGTTRATPSSGYSRYNKNFRETNLDLMVNFKKDLTEDFNLSGLVGTNIRRSYENTVFAATNGGLVTPKLYALTNSKEALTPPTEYQALIGVNGFFANISLGYKRFLYLDVTARQDYSSTLPAGKNHFFYPGVSGSFIFSEKMKGLTWMDFGKLRLNYAKVGNDAPFGSLQDVYTSFPVFGSSPLFSLPNTKNNNNLVAELSTTAEAGLEMAFLKKRVGFDLAVYNKKTENQIVPVAVSAATGYTSKFVNAGTIQNRGVELNLFVTPVQVKDFKWTVTLNFAKNVSKVVKLFEGVDNIQIATYAQGVTLNASLGEPYGTLKGTDYVYLNGQKVVDKNGYYKKTTTSTNVIGNITPDFTAGITNTLTYKSWSLSFLVDCQKGGDLFSLDMAYGMATGLYPETAGLNADGHPVRDPVSQGGGVILDGVNEAGEKNTKVADATEFGLYGYVHNPNRAFIYDASYVKLREIGLNYRIPFKKEHFFNSATIGLVANNVWIIFKNLPYADPEAGLSAGNSQGYQVGVMPTTRNFGFNLTLQF